jgi:soluble lytic murein transglycosylase-like protein
MDSNTDRPTQPVYPIRLQVEEGDIANPPDRITGDVTLGRARDCDLVFGDAIVSSHHASLTWEDGKWWVQDLKSRNGTYLNGKPVTRTLLPPTARLQLAKNGPVLQLEVELPIGAGAGADMTIVERPELTMVADHYFGEGAKEDAGERTTMIRRAYQKVNKKKKRHYWSIIGVVAFLLIATAAALYFQTRRVERLDRLHEVAANMFYSMKGLELQLMRLQFAIAERADADLKRELEQKLAEQQSLQAQYDAFVSEEFGISRDQMEEQEWLIYKVARMFGECDVNMPPEFKEKVAEYIQRWKTTGRLQRAVERAQRNGYTQKIVEQMSGSGLPALFYYLGLQESNFNVRIVGPPTRFGIAKGMWQFIPKTAGRYGLKTGPQVEDATYDPADERHHFEKSTEAASRYLRDLYQTDAQGSGLLVMACYNWGEWRVLPIVQRMPENPRERNFWNLLGKAKVPEETFGYVFSIVSAAVIGENPKLFGFDFDPPLPPALPGPDLGRSGQAGHASRDETDTVQQEGTLRSDSAAVDSGRAGGGEADTTQASGPPLEL